MPRGSTSSSSSSSVKESKHAATGEQVSGGGPSAEAVADALDAFQEVRGKSHEKLRTKLVALHQKIRDKTGQPVFLASKDKKTTIPHHKELKGVYGSLFKEHMARVQALTGVLDVVMPLAATRLQSARKRAAERPMAEDAPVKRGKHERFEGDVWTHEDYLLAKGSQVAALVDADSKPRLWILATVLSCTHTNSKRPPRYEVLDADAAPTNDSGPKKRYKLDRSKVIPLTDPDMDITDRKEFKKGFRLIALYPVGGVTTLYPAEVHGPPSKTRSDDYELVFDDDDDTLRRVNRRYVCPVPNEWV
jgi:hypothetical protein